MIITHEINDLYDFQPWAGAVNTYETIVNADKGKQFMNELESIYPNGIRYYVLDLSAKIAV